MSDLEISKPILMDFIPFYSVSIPISMISLVLNFFLVFCLLCPNEDTERPKQPLNVLLGTFVTCNINLQICIFLFIILQYDPSDLGFAVIVEMTMFSMRTSVSSSLWLNVFYYCQIVPAQRSVFICLKRNIRFFIYSVLIIDKSFFLFSFAVGISYNAVYLGLQAYNFNETYKGSDEAQETLDRMNFMFDAELWVRLSYSLLCLFVMLGSSCATVLYLQRHMKNMEGSSSPNSLTQRQMRVTITGVVQTVLFFLCLVWLILSDLLRNMFLVDIDSSYFIGCTVLCLYTFGTTINLCVGQTIFRQRMAKVLAKMPMWS